MHITIIQNKKRQWFEDYKFCNNCIAFFKPHIVQISALQGILQRIVNLYKKAPPQEKREWYKGKVWLLYLNFLYKCHHNNIDIEISNLILNDFYKDLDCNRICLSANGVSKVNNNDLETLYTLLSNSKKFKNSSLLSNNSRIERILLAYKQARHLKEMQRNFSNLYISKIPY